MAVRYTRFVAEVWRRDGGVARRAGATPRLMPWIMTNCF